MIPWEFQSLYTKCAREFSWYPTMNSRGYWWLSYVLMTAIADVRRSQSMSYDFNCKKFFIFSNCYSIVIVCFCLIAGRILDKNWSTKEEINWQWKNYQLTLTQVWHFPSDKIWATLEFDFKVWEEVIYSVEDNLS